MIYIMSPYSSPDKNYEDLRYAQACAWVSQNVVRYPVLLYSPIVYWHPIARAFNLPTDALYWEGVNMDIMSVSDEAFLLRMPGWHESKGVAGEIAYFRRLHLPISEQDDPTWK